MQTVATKLSFDQTQLDDSAKEQIMKSREIVTTSLSFLDYLVLKQLCNEAGLDVAKYIRKLIYTEIINYERQEKVQAS